MPIHKIVPFVDDNQLSKNYIPRISKNGDNQRIIDEESPLTEGKKEQVDFESENNVETNFLITTRKQTGSGQNSYSNNKGGIYFISSQREYPSKPNTNNGLLIKPRNTPSFPEGCGSSATVNDIPRVDQGSTPYCALISSLSEIAAALGINIDMQKTIHCGVTPCEESDTTDDFAIYPGYDRDRYEAYLRSDVEKFFKQECNSLSGAEKDKCINNLRTRYRYLLDNPFLDVKAYDQLGDTGSRLQKHMHQRRIQLRFFLAMTGSDLLIAISCADPTNQCLQNTPYVSIEDCDSACSDLCTTTVNIAPQYDDISTNDMIAKLCSGVPIIISLNSKALLGYKGRFVEQARKYVEANPDGPPEKFEDINLDIFSEPIIELNPQEDLIAGELNHAVIIDSVQILDSGYLLIRIRNSWGNKPYKPQFYTIAIPPGKDLRKLVDVGAIVGSNSRVIVGYTLTPSTLNLEEICDDCGETIGSCPTPTPTVTPTVSVTPTVTPTVSVTPTVTPTVSVTPTISPTPTITNTPTVSVTPSSSSGGSTPTPSIPT